MKNIRVILIIEGIIICFAFTITAVIKTDSNKNGVPEKIYDNESVVASNTIDKTKSDRKITFSYQKNEDKEVIRFEPLFDEDNSRKIYSELSDKEKEAQKYTAQLVGYKRLSDEQTNTLLNIIDENGNNIYWNKMMTVIGENNTDHRITMDYVQEVLDYVKKQNLLSKTDELDLIYDCFYRDHYYIDLTTGSGNVVDIFWIDQDEKQCIYLVNGNTLCYGEKVDGKLKEINRLV